MIIKEKGQVPFSTDRALMAPTKWEQARVATKKTVIKKEKGQIPFPPDRALNDADKVKTGLCRYKKGTINV